MTVQLATDIARIVLVHILTTYVSWWCARRYYRHAAERPNFFDIILVLLPVINCIYGLTCLLITIPSKTQNFARRFFKLDDNENKKQ